MAPVLAKQLDFSSLLVAYRKAQGGGRVRAGFKRGTRPAKGVGMPTGYTRFGGGCTRLAAETLACYYLLGSLYKDLVVSLCNHT